MKRVFLMLAALAAVGFASSLELDRPLPVYGTDDLLQYDDGTAYWLTWGGTYRGTWFDVEDFIPGAPGWLTYESELWFYHHADRPWDTASFYCELWNGGVGAPTDQLDQTSVTAVHYAPCYADYGDGIATDLQFWVIINSEMSAGGWPSVLGDNTPNSTDHSFFSDDFVVWEPWVIQGPTANDYFIRSEGDPEALSETTWGAIKGMYN
ncbi:hypothetical protein JW921_01640 [Candidatus Fermentibacterales bacterium]|nr:hypothetical protein [Candidatus Fermentibacterales bacterium]